MTDTQEKKTPSPNAAPNHIPPHPSSAYQNTCALPKIHKILSCDIILSWKDLGCCFVVVRGRRLDLERVFRLQRSLVEFVVPGHGMRMQSFAVPCSSALLPHDVISICQICKAQKRDTFVEFSFFVSSAFSSRKA
jgi:hypothetical protein